MLFRSLAAPVAPRSRLRPRRIREGTIETLNDLARRLNAAAANAPAVRTPESRHPQLESTFPRISIRPSSDHRRPQFGQSSGIVATQPAGLPLRHTRTIEPEYHDQLTP